MTSPKNQHSVHKKTNEKTKVSNLSASLPRTTADLVDWARDNYSNKTFIVDGETHVSFNDLAKNVQALACSLVDHGFADGDRAAIWAPNCPQWIVAALAIQYVGGTLVTVNTRYKPSEARDILEDSGSAIVFAVDAFLDTEYADALKAMHIDGVRHIVSIRAPGTDRSDDFSRWLAGGEGATRDIRLQCNAMRAKLSPEHVSDILFTSGTTGRAKGVVTTHGQNLRAFDTFSSILGIDEQDRYLIINPFFHSFGYKAGWLAALLRGATVYPMAVFSVPEVLATVKTHAITVMPGPPTLFQSILMHPDLDPSDISSLKKATTGAATIPTQLIVDMRTILGIDTVITAYGLSETCGLVTMCRAGDAPDVIAKTSGRAIPGVEVGIMDIDGALLPSEEPGEIVVRGFNVMSHYFNNAEATAEAIDADGWLHTGDIGVLDHDGNIRITDRLKDMFISGGFNCYPAEIENQLLQHAAVAQVAIVGMPDPRMGEVCAAFVVIKAGETVSESDLISWCKGTMANFKVPRKIIFASELPLNASGKVLKTQLRTML
jgi:acyl-CoA synthetase (AMP-forming)/AMP-acid ligase II